MADDLLATVNADRASNGAAPLATDPRLVTVARHWATRMAARGALEHQDLGPVLDLGFDNAGETILAGPPGMDAPAAQRAWMASPQNRSTLLTHAFASAGVGIAFDADGRVWVAFDVAG
jgi:uncharacterized protein YkwD